MNRNIYHTHIKKTFSPLFLHNEWIAQFSIVWVTMSCQNVKRLDTLMVVAVIGLPFYTLGF